MERKSLKQVIAGTVIFGSVALLGTVYCIGENKGYAEVTRERIEREMKVETNPWLLRALYYEREENSWWWS